MQLNVVIENNPAKQVIECKTLGVTVDQHLSAKALKAKAKMMYKLLNNMGPQSLTKLFTYKDEVASYNLQNISSNLCLPHPRTNNMKRSFMYGGAFLWNSIPREIKESKSLSSFRTKIATHIDS